MLLKALPVASVGFVIETRDRDAIFRGARRLLLDVETLEQFMKFSVKLVCHCSFSLYFAQAIASANCGCAGWLAMFRASSAILNVTGMWCSPQNCESRACMVRWIVKSRLNCLVVHW